MLTSLCSGSRCKFDSKLFLCSVQILEILGFLKDFVGKPLCLFDHRDSVFGALRLNRGVFGSPNRCTSTVSEPFSGALVASLVCEGPESYRNPQKMFNSALDMSKPIVTLWSSEHRSSLAISFFGFEHRTIPFVFSRSNDRNFISTLRFSDAIFTKLDFKKTKVRRLWNFQNTQKVGGFSPFYCQSLEYACPLFIVKSYALCAPMGRNQQTLRL